MHLSNHYSLYHRGHKDYPELLRRIRLLRLHWILLRAMTWHIWNERKRHLKQNSLQPPKELIKEILRDSQISTPRMIDGRFSISSKSPTSGGWEFAYLEIWAYCSCSLLYALSNCMYGTGKIMALFLEVWSTQHSQSRVWSEHS